MDPIKPRVVIAGGSGFLGNNLAHALIEAGWDVCILSRHAPKARGPWTHAPWDACSLGDWCQHLNGAAAIVNLAGRSVDCIKSPDHCDQILRSRVQSTQVLGRAIRQVASPPPVWVQMSTAHIYGDPPEIHCTEDSPLGYGLAPFVGQAWEKALMESALPTMRQVIFRTSFVLGRSGGALQRLASLARFGLGGTVGHGRQGISWVHEVDMNRLLLRAITDESMSGMYIATAPHPVSNAIFMRQLRKAIGMPIGLPAYAWMVKLAALLILKTDPELALYGRYCKSTRLAEAGFEFRFPAIDQALNDLFHASPSAG